LKYLRKIAKNIVKDILDSHDKAAGREEQECEFANGGIYPGD